MREIAAWHELLFWVGILTMVLGGIMALLTMNIKRRAGLVQHEPDRVYPGRRRGCMDCFPITGASPRRGWSGIWSTIRVFKMILFLCAGVAVMQTGKAGT